MTVASPEARREGQLRAGLGAVTAIVGATAVAGTLGQYVLGTGSFRPFALVLHIGLTAVGVSWLRHPPQAASRAAFFVGAYLSTQIGTFILSTGDVGALANLAMVSIGAALMIPVRRWMLATQLATFGWFAAALTVSMQTPDRAQLMIDAVLVAGASFAVAVARRRMSTHDAADSSTARPSAPLVADPAAPKSASRTPVPALSPEVVHDVNNLLGGILGGAELALASERHPEDLQFALNQIRERALATRDYLRQSASPAKTRELVSVAQVVERVARLAEGVAGPELRLVVEHGSEVPDVAAERSTLERALLNLVFNAIDASPERRGEIRIRSSVSSGDPAQVVLRVEDGGEGVPAAIRSRIFQPGFTTRAGDHRGLGLAFVAGVAADLGGEVALDDRVSSGAAIELRIPASSSASRERATRG